LNLLSWALLSAKVIENQKKQIRPGVTHPRNPFIPPGLPFIAREKLNAPPLTATALSIPLGLPWMTFSAKNAHPLIKSA